MTNTFSKAKRAAQQRRTLASPNEMLQMRQRPPGEKWRTSRCVCARRRKWVERMAIARALPTMVPMAHPAMPIALQRTNEMPQLLPSWATYDQKQSRVPPSA